MAARVKWEGQDAIRGLLVPIDKYEPDPRNSRKGDIDGIAESLARFGQLRPILVNKTTKLIVAGHHTRLAARDVLGWNRVAAVEASMTDEEAEAYVVADNRLADRGSYDEGLLATALQSLYERGALTGTGYSPDEAEDEIARLRGIAETSHSPTEARHSETADDLAAREALRNASASIREVVLPMSDETFGTFSVDLKILMKEWDISGVTDTVVRAVSEARKAVQA